MTAICADFSMSEFYHAPRKVVHTRSMLQSEHFAQHLHACIRIQTRILESLGLLRHRRHESIYEPQQQQNWQA
jgi:hypothetical protein